MSRWSDGKERTPEELQLAREYAAAYDTRCIEAAKRGDYHVNDLARYVAFHEEGRDRILRGEDDGNFTIWQRMNTFLTGKCVPLFAPREKAA